ncbi:MAG: hypothetical protein IPI46_07670 [Bacteroidetes bacterium]|nr:hypothetical protein [Bacteroidota bacterium]
MKIFTPIFASLLILSSFFIFSCKQKLQNGDAYNSNKDTIPPVLALTVPVNLDNYAYGEDIHIVGTATDLQMRNKIREYAGKLKSLTMTVSTIDPTPDTVKKVIFSKNLAVDGKSGYIFNQSLSVLSGSGTTNCRLIGVATDYADRKDSVIVNFTVN